MAQEIRTSIYDDELRLEAYRLTGIAQPFPIHFHEYYVLGLMENGQRTLSCKGREYTIRPGDMLLFNPGAPMPAPRATAAHWITVESMLQKKPCGIWLGK